MRQAHTEQVSDTAADDQLLTTKELAKKLKRSPATIRLWHTTGYGPPGFRIAGMVMYRESKTNEWIAEQEQQAGVA
jgi:predicted DNA-binding transcriptional regulator AlpA